MTNHIETGIVNTLIGEHQDYIKVDHIPNQYGDIIKIQIQDKDDNTIKTLELNYRQAVQLKELLEDRISKIKNNYM